MDGIFVLCAAVFNLSIAGIFIASRFEKTQLIRKVFGPLIIGLSIPFAIILIRYDQMEKGLDVTISLLLVLIYQIAELLLDYIFKYDFRSRWVTHLPYIVLEYGAFFGLIHVASTISKTATWFVAITFWIAMGCLVFLYSGGKPKSSPDSNGETEK